MDENFLLIRIKLKKRVFDKDKLKIKSETHFNLKTSNETKTGLAILVRLLKLF